MDAEQQDEGGDDEGSSKNINSSMSTSAEDGIWSSSTIEASARFMCAMLPSIAGDHATALISLRRFPVTHRLSNAMWTGENESAHQVSEDGSTSPTTSLLLDKSEPSRYLREGGLLPSTLYQSLCKIFGPNAAYWKESNSAKRDYFSFFCDLPPKDAPPSNLIEDVVVNYLLPLARRQLSIDEADRICGYEWWVVSKQSEDDLGANLHFEHDYALKDLYQKEIRPFLSSILYLEGHKKGSGASIVLDQTQDSTKDAEYGWRLSPTDNSLLVFPGENMRGTMPQNSKHPSKPPTDRDEGGDDDDDDDDKPPTIVKMRPSDMEDDGQHVNDHKLPTALLTTITQRQLLNVADLWQVQREEPNSNKTGRDDDGPGHTLTFMAAFWGHRVPDSLEKSNGDSYQPYTPAGPLPPNTSEHTWVHDIHVGYELPSSAMAGPAMQQPQTANGNLRSKKRRQMAATHLENVKGSKLRRIGPVWDAVNDGGDDYDDNDNNHITDDGVASVTSTTSSRQQPYLKVPDGFSNRFFLQSSGESGSIASAVGRDDGNSSIQTTNSNR